MERESCRFEIDHPIDAGTTLVYGSDRGADFVEIHRNGVCSFICFVEVFGKPSAAREVVRWTIEQGFFSVADVDDAIAALETQAVQQLSPRLRSLATLVLHFKPEFVNVGARAR